MSDQPRAWERMEKETSKAYAAFQAYLELGPERSLGKLLEGLGKPSGYMRQLESWSSAWAWTERVAMWDDHLAELRRETHEEVVLRMSERHAEELEALQETLMAPVRELHRRITTSKADGGYFRNLKRHEVISLSGQAARLLPTLVTTERLVRGASTSAPGAPEPPKDRSELEKALAGFEDGYSEPEVKEPADAS